MGRKKRGHLCALTFARTHHAHCHRHGLVPLGAKSTSGPLETGLGENGDVSVSIKRMGGGGGDRWRWGDK